MHVAPALKPLLQSVFPLSTRELTDILTRLSLLNMDIDPEPLINAVEDASDSVRVLRFQRAAINLIGEDVEEGVKILRQALLTRRTVTPEIDLDEEWPADMMDIDIENVEVVPVNIYDTVKKTIGPIDVGTIVGSVGDINSSNILSESKVSYFLHFYQFPNFHQVKKII